MQQTPSTGTAAVGPASPLFPCTIASPSAHATAKLRGPSAAPQHSAHRAKLTCNMHAVFSSQGRTHSTPCWVKTTRSWRGLHATARCQLQTCALQCPILQQHTDLLQQHHSPTHRAACWCADDAAPVHSTKRNTCVHHAKAQEAAHASQSRAQRAALLLQSGAGRHVIKHTPACRAGQSRAAQQM